MVFPGWDGALHDLGMLARGLVAQIPRAGAQKEQPGPIWQEGDAPRVAVPGSSRPQPDGYRSPRCSAGTVHLWIAPELPGNVLSFAPAKSKPNASHAQPGAGGEFTSCLLAPASKVLHAGSPVQLVVGKVLVYPPRAI